MQKMILFGENMVRNAVRQYLIHYHQERNHQSLDNKIIQPGDEVGGNDGEIQCSEQLGGLLRYYFRKAAKLRSPMPVVCRAAELRRFRKSGWLLSRPLLATVSMGVFGRHFQFQKQEKEPMEIV